jgi:hypothetical protein
MGTIISGGFDPSKMFGVESNAPKKVRNVTEEKNKFPSKIILPKEISNDEFIQHISKTINTHYVIIVLFMKAKKNDEGAFEFIINNKKSYYTNLVIGPIYSEKGLNTLSDAYEKDKKDKMIFFSNKCEGCYLFYTDVTKNLISF